MNFSYFKSIIFSFAILFFGLGFFNPVGATLTFDPVSPAAATAIIDISCSEGSYLHVCNDGNCVTPALECPFNDLPADELGSDVTLVFIESSTSTVESLIEDERLSGDYISESEYTILPYNSVLTRTPNSATVYENDTTHLEFTTDDPNFTGGYWTFNGPGNFNSECLSSSEFNGIWGEGASEGFENEPLPMTVNNYSADDCTYPDDFIAAFDDTENPFMVLAGSNPESGSSTLATLNVPSAGAFINSMKDYGNGYFNEFGMTIIGVVGGLAAAGLFILWFTRQGIGFLARVFGVKKNDYF